MIKLPFVFRVLPTRLVIAYSKQHLNVGEALKFLMPKLKTDLFQADISLKPESYINVCFFSTILFFTIFLAISILIFLPGFLGLSQFFIPELFSFQAFLINIFVSVFLAVTIFIYSINYPKLLAIKRVRELERTLLTALRHMLIKIRSGVPLFNALTGLSEGYGELSKEVKITVSKINAGMPITEALDESAAKNPSMHFRRALWQISNTLKVGADISSSLSSIVDSFLETQIIKATRYGRELNMLSMLYMILTVIFPTLGVTFLVILSSFIGIYIDWFLLFLIALSTVVIQLFFLSMIRSRKPYMVT